MSITSAAILWKVDRHIKQSKSLQDSGKSLVGFFYLRYTDGDRKKNLATTSFFDR